MKIALFITCLTESYAPRTGIALVRVLEHLGHEVVFPAAQTCCGQPMYNGGFHPQARALVRRMVRVFADAQTIVTPSASCAAMVREQGPRLFAEGSADRAAAEALAARTHEFTGFLVRVLGVDLRRLGARGSGRVTCHPPCHLRGLGTTDDTARLAGQIAGLETVALEKADQCCGFGGTFAVQYPSISGSMVREKVACIRASGAETVICNDAGCAMNIAGACRREGCTRRIASLAEIIAEGLGLLEGARD